ncbi:Splicing factor 3B subunit 4, partial [Gonapodya sp. JEL0774]
MAQQQYERNQDNTLYVGNLDEKVADALIWELFLQAGPVGWYQLRTQMPSLPACSFHRIPAVNVYLPKDRVTMLHQGYGFVEFNTEDDAEYAIRIMSMVKLYGKPIRVNKASSDRKNVDIGATLFVGGLDPEVDEKMIYDTFSQFGQIVQPPK